MKKEDLDALAGLYEGVYSPNSGEYLNEDYLLEYGENAGLGYARSPKEIERMRLNKPYVSRFARPRNANTTVRNSATGEVLQKPKMGGINDPKYRGQELQQAARARASQVKPTTSTTPANTGSGNTGSGNNGGGSPGSAKVAPAAAKPAGQTGDKAKDMATWAKANPTLANKPKTPNPLMQKTFGYQTGNAPDQVAKTAAATATAGKNLTGTGALAPKPTPSTTPIRKPGAVMASFEWGSKATLKDVASLYSSIYEGKKKDQDEDGDNDFADVRIARMIASGMSKAEAIAAVKNKEYNEEFESWVDSLVEEGYDLSDYTMDEMFDIYLDEAEGSYGATPKAYSAASKTKMTAKRKPFLKKMLSRTNPANRTDPYGSPRKGMTADDRESARAGSKHGVGTRQEHDYPSEGPGGVTKSAKKLRKQKAMGEFGEAYEIDEATLSAKAARAGKDIGAKGKNFAKIAASAGERYGSAEAGKRVAGAILKRMRANEEFKLDEAAKRTSKKVRGAKDPVEYMKGRSDAGKRISGDEDTGPRYYTLGRARGAEADAPTQPGQKPVRTPKLAGWEKDDIQYRKANLKAGKTHKIGGEKGLPEEYEVYEIVASYLLENNFASTLNDANVIIENMSEVWLDQILSEAPGEWFGGLRDKARASRAAQMQSSQPTPKPGPTVSSPFAKPASRNDSGSLTTYGAGGGAAAERGGKTRSQVMQQGAKNLENKNRNPGPDFGR